MPAQPPDADLRLAALEQAVEALREEVATLRAASRVAQATDAPVRGAAGPPVAPAVTYATFGTRAPTPARSRVTNGIGAAARRWVSGLGMPELPADRLGLETLVGRYAAVAVGALVLLMGVGAFLTWAVANFTLAPSTRVALGLLGAAALAALGERLRRREGAERFGEVLLALALAVVHVDAWAAGPYLQLVTPEFALGAAAVASVALTALAWRTRQQSLFVVGVGGALLAPFVSGAGDAHPLVRPVYGWLVLTAGVAALVRGSEARHPWRGAARLLALGTAVYTAAQLSAGTSTWVGNSGNSQWLRLRVTEHDIAPAFALACALAPLAVLLWHARRPRAVSVEADASRGSAADATDGVLVGLSLAQLTTAVVALWVSAGATVGGGASLVLYALATMLASQIVAALPATAHGFGHDRWRWPGGPLSSIVLAALALPLATLGAALVAYGHTGTLAVAGIAALWSAISALAATVAWRRTAGGQADPRLGPHLAAAGLASALVPLLWTDGHDALRLALLGAHAAVTAALFARVPGHPVTDSATGPLPSRDTRPLLALAPPLVVLVGATGWGAVLLHARPAFAYTPFLTAPSAAMAVVVAGWAVCAAVVWRAGNALLPRNERAAVVAVTAAVALLWGREELARAVAPDMATFLLVGYFATAGVAALALGRARRIPAARQAGLALALYAALKAIVEVSQLDAVALRVGSYLLVGGFLLGVGYWYRAGSTAPGALREG